MHEQRLKNLRDASEKLKEDSWKYQSTDKLLGLWFTDSHNFYRGTITSSCIVIQVYFSDY